MERTKRALLTPVLRNVCCDLNENSHMKHHLSTSRIDAKRISCERTIEWEREHERVSSRESDPLSKTQAAQIISHRILSSLFHICIASPLLPSFALRLMFVFIFSLFCVFSFASCALPSFLLARHIVSDCTNLIVYRSKVNEDVRAWRAVYWYATTRAVSMCAYARRVEVLVCIAPTISPRSHGHRWFLMGRRVEARWQALFLFTMIRLHSDANHIDRPHSGKHMGQW